MPSRLYQYHRALNPYTGVAESGITSNVMFLGDAAMITYSWSTASTTASRLTLQGYEGADDDGFRVALPAATAEGWQTVIAVTAQGYGSVLTIPRWGRFLRNPSASSSTLFISIHVGP